MKTFNREFIPEIVGVMLDFNVEEGEYRLMKVFFWSEGRERPFGTVYGRFLPSRERLGYENAHERLDDENARERLG